MGGRGVGGGTGNVEQEVMGEVSSVESHPSTFPVLYVC